MFVLNVPDVLPLSAPHSALTICAPEKCTIENRLAFQHVCQVQAVEWILRIGFVPSRRTEGRGPLHGGDWLIAYYPRGRDTRPPDDRRDAHTAFVQFHLLSRERPVI